MEIFNQVVLAGIVLLFVPGAGLLLPVAKTRTNYLTNLHLRLFIQSGG